MSIIFRCGFSKIIQSNKTSNVVLNNVRLISGKALRVEKPKPAPYPYKTKKYGLIQRLFDKTTSRFDENTKLIVVDGPIASCKSTFAKDLADDLGMFYMPEANLDMVYINEYGFDMRTLDSKIPESCRSFDVKDFCLDPNNSKTAIFQMMMYAVRYSQYIDALAHLLSTGQGVVLDRSVYSDFVFLEAMFKSCYVSRGLRSAYYELRGNTITELMRPHLVIYLDVGVDKVAQNIQNRKIPYELKSKVFTREYLQTMEHNYKQKYLKDISEHSEILVYDWSNGGDIEVVVEDIERIDFDRYTKHDKKLSDWRIEEEEEWGIARNLYTDGKEELLMYLNVPRFDVKELVIDAEEWKAAVDVWEEAPGNKYVIGYNKEVGDTGILFKTSNPHRYSLPLRERKIC